MRGVLPADRYMGLVEGVKKGIRVFYYPRALVKTMNTLGQPPGLWHCINSCVVMYCRFNQSW